MTKLWLRLPSVRVVVIVASAVALVGFVNVAKRPGDGLIDTVRVGAIGFTPACPNAALNAALAQRETDRARLDELLANPPRPEAFDPDNPAKLRDDAAAHDVSAASYAAVAAATPPQWCGLGLPYRWLLSVCVLAVAARLAISRTRAPAEKRSGLYD